MLSNFGKPLQKSLVKAGVWFIVGGNKAQRWHIHARAAARKEPRPGTHPCTDSGGRAGPGAHLLEWAPACPSVASAGLGRFPGSAGGECVCPPPAPTSSGPRGSWVWRGRPCSWGRAHRGGVRPSPPPPSITSITRTAFAIGNSRGAGSRLRGGGRSPGAVGHMGAARGV